MKRIVLLSAAALAGIAVAATTSSASAQANTNVTVAPAAPPPAQVNVQPGTTVAPSPVIVTPSRDIATEEKKTPNVGLITSGAVMFGATYTASLAVAASSGRSADDHLYIPLAGPWIDLADRGACRGGNCNREAGYKALLVADGLLQGAGALMFISGFVFPTTKTVTRTAAVKPGVHFAPSAGLGSVGMQAYGAF
jgi:hypothetical protein